MRQIVLNVDCTTIDPRGFDVLGTDPPYSAHVHQSIRSQIGSTRTAGVRHVDVGFDFLSDDLRSYVAEAARSARRWSLIYTDLQSAGAWETAISDGRHRYVRSVVAAEVELGGGFAIADGGYVGSLPWVRWSSPQSSGDRPPSGAELLVLGHGPGKMVWGGPGNLVALSHKCLRGNPRDPSAKHSTEKPLDQALDLVAWFSSPGDRWYDPCAGRGTFGVACALLGRNYVGCEINADECARANDRITAAVSGVLTRKIDSDRLAVWSARNPGWRRSAEWRKGSVVG